MKAEYIFNLYMMAPPRKEPIDVTQNDNLMVELVAKLKNRNGTAFLPPEGAVANFIAVKPDGTGIVLRSDDPEDPKVTLADDEVRVSLPREALAVTGWIACKIAIQDNDAVASSQEFSLICNRDLLPEDFTESDAYQSIIYYLEHLGEREAEFDDMKEQFYQAINGLTEDDEVINARIDGPYSTTYDTLKLRLDAMSALLKGIVNGDFENRVSDLEDEVEDARGEFDALVDRLDDTDGRIADNAGEIDSAKVKILQLEQENKQLKKIVEDSNPTQSPRVTSTGYGVVSLPKNAAQGPMDVKVEGLTLKNELDYNPETWEEWVLADNASISNGLVLAGTGSASTSYLNINAKSNTKYGLLLNVLENSINGTFRMSNSLTGTTEILFEGGLTGSFKKTVLTQGVIENNYIGLNLSSSSTEGEVKISDIRLFELPPGSEIESDFETLSADELARKYPYVQGGETRNTSGTYRVKSVGKNLFDKNNHNQFTFLYGGGSFVEHEGVKCIRVTKWYGRNIILFNGEPNMRYTVTVRIKADTAASTMGITFYYDDGTLDAALIPSNNNFVTLKRTTSEGKTLKEIGFGSSDNVEAFIDLDSLQIEKGTAATPYEPYISSEQYVNGPELRSLPNGTKDEVRVSGGKAELVKRIGTKILDGSEDWTSQATYNTKVVLVYMPVAQIGNNVSGIMGSLWCPPFTVGAAGLANVDSINMINFNMPGTNLIIDIDKTWLATPDVLGFKAWLQANPLTLTYQLAEPIVTPINVSGNLISYPSGTVYVENVVADAGIYTDKMEVLYSDLPIKALEKISKVDFGTGLETELDVSETVIAGDKLSFTHPDLEAGDIVFFVYEYDRESTVGETEIEYYDSRYVIKDSVTDKFYKWNVTVADGVPSIELVEV